MRSPPDPQQNLTRSPAEPNQSSNRTYSEPPQNPSRTYSEPPQNLTRSPAEPVQNLTRTLAEPHQSPPSVPPPVAVWFGGQIQMEEVHQTDDITLLNLCLSWNPSHLLRWFVLGHGLNVIMFSTSRLRSDWPTCVNELTCFFWGGAFYKV